MFGSVSAGDGVSLLASVELLFDNKLKINAKLSRVFCPLYVICCMFSWATTYLVHMQSSVILSNTNQCGYFNNLLIDKL